MKTNKKALIVEGGGNRGVFSFGVIDSFIKSSFDPFNLYIGVSNGSVVLLWYLLRETDNNIDKMLISASKEYINYGNFFLNKDMFNYRKLFQDAESKYPISFKKLSTNLGDKKFYIVTTDALSGHPEYLEPTESILVNQLLASGTLPLLVRTPSILNNKRKFDGGLSDPLPVQKAYDMGAREITIIRTYEKEFTRTNKLENYLGAFYIRQYKETSKKLINHSETYNKSLKFINNPPNDCKINQICPPERLKTKRDTIDKTILISDYELGKKIGNKFLEKKIY